MTEEEFNLKPRKVMEKYKYIASCGVPHEVCFIQYPKIFVLFLVISI